jgi:hypothetical protein
LLVGSRSVVQSARRRLLAYWTFSLLLFVAGLVSCGDSLLLFVLPVSTRLVPFRTAVSTGGSLVQFIQISCWLAFGIPRTPTFSFLWRWLAPLLPSELDSGNAFFFLRYQSDGYDSSVGSFSSSSSGASDRHSCTSYHLVHSCARSADQFYSYRILVAPMASQALSALVAVVATLALPLL